MKRAVLSSLIALAVAGATACGSEEPPRNLILISIDTLRADRLGVYGAERDNSPHLDAIAREGVIFEQAMSTAPWTLPSHASLFTGRYPSQHGVTTVRHALDENVPTLAAHLRAHGFETGAIVNVGYLQGRFGLGRGFSHLAFAPADSSPDGATRRIVERATLWLQSRREQRCFLFVHLFDVHSDYRSRPAFEAAVGASSERIDATSARLVDILGGTATIAPQEIDGLSRLYDAGVRQLDEDLSTLLAFLDQWGWLDDSLLVVTSDHGEEFLEHGKVLHGASQYEEVLRIPLLMRGPGIPADRRIATPVSLVDIAPTALAALGVPPMEDTDGLDLHPLWNGTGTAPFENRPIFAEAAPGIFGEALRAVRRGDDKLIVDTRSGVELYDLAEDPGETRDRAAAEPDRVRELEAALAELAESARQKTAAGDLSAEEWSALEALGYLRNPEAAPADSDSAN